MSAVLNSVPSIARSYHDPVQPTASAFALLSAYLGERNIDLLIGECGKSRENTRTVRLSTVLAGPYNVGFIDAGHGKDPGSEKDACGTIIIRGYEPSERQPRDLRIQPVTKSTGEDSPYCEVYPLSKDGEVLHVWGDLVSAEVKDWPQDFGPRFQLLLPATR